MQGNPFANQMEKNNDNVAGARTIPKTLQEVFSPPPNRITTRRGQDPAVIIRNMDIDPARINDTLLRNIGLDSLVPEKGTGKEDRMSAAFEAIPHVCEVLMKMEEMLSPAQGMGDRMPIRMLRMGEGPQEGMVFVTQANNSNHKTPSVMDLFAATRRIHHIRDTHTAEVDQLIGIQQQLEDIFDDIENWNKLSVERKTEQKDDLLKMVDALKHVKNENKRKMKYWITFALGFRDSRGRTNPNATRRKLTEAGDELKERLADIRSIAAHLGADAALLREELIRNGKPMKKFLTTVEGMELRKDGAQLHLFREAPLMPDAKQKVLRNLRQRRDDMEAVRFEPYRSYAQTFIKWADNVIENIDADQQTQPDFLALYLVTKLKKAHGIIMHAYEKISLSGEDIDHKQLLRRLEAAHEEFKGHKVKKDTAVPENMREAFYEAFRAHHHFLNSLKKRLREIDEGEKTRDEAFLAFKKRVSGFDFRGTIQGLNPTPRTE
jgi:hypothetical protein